ncbi:MAG: hypothetical protein H6Q10_1219 [Acidobacteria bacterium]|nr:hypothetical protein [Acidobacteriota bacterium]
MRLRPRVSPIIVAVAFVLSAGLLAGCGSSQSSPPSPSPTAPATAPASGATITGLVTNLATGAPATGTITVIDSGLTATIGQSGEFTLSGLPAGNVELQVSTTAGTTVVSVLGLHDQERRRLTLAVGADGGSMAGGCDGEPDQDRLRLRDRIRDVTGTCPNLGFTVAGIRVATNASTQFSGGTCADVRAGAGVEVVGVRAQNGEVLAQQVQVRERVQNGGTLATIRSQVRSFTGSCPSTSFTLDGIAVVTTRQTQFVGGKCQLLRNGVTVEAQGPRAGNGKGAMTASRVQFQQGQGGR